MSLKQRVRVDIYNAAGSFTWTKFLGAKWVNIQILSAGGGGQAGTVIAPGLANGVNGGQGGGYGEIDLPASVLGTTETVVIGAGGSGAIAGGAAANAGGNSSFGPWLFTRGGNIGGVNGRGAGFPAGVAATNTVNSPDTGGDPAAANATGFRAGAGGGIGGGFSNATTPIAPNPGGSTQPQVVTNPGASAPGIVVGQAGGAVGTPNGGAGNDTIPGAVWGGSGGGGGLSAVAANGGNGGAGIKGSGGGAGAQAFTGFTAGNGGKGGDGYAIITTFF